ncbi:isoleucine--tRNA ligase [Priestia taiwanensis]|uniref:Isoleucine--tRNA ligase n=1 Tax=Priestia taiwanensis TaxID=1347902 RepID=A0A917AMX4_9BACI|nr:isoleucine--tRNA ligase [Priestia taiwanensis]MBM7362340.1 isoleucyl-tRNA synthetase [Priestia taiwanensis]GGE61390.1 isoleucine--tRNA ligase 2 [Priestia taiwanensis]
MKNDKETVQQRELRIRKQWVKEDTFKQSVTGREGKPSFVFYEGPPTANGLPHVGHALGRTIKDVVARYKTMAGYQVVRKAGWDTHGLPVELGVEKQLGISGKSEIENYGVEAFIKKCKESVFVYEKQWREFTEQLGYWVDMDDPYVTLNNSYIESVWHILGTIHEKGLLYKGHRVSPYCPSCQTSLSSHEVAQGYKVVKDLSATAKFKVTGRDNEYFLAWTTTPWTLPANVALAVHPEMNYVRAKQGNDVFIVAESLVERVLKESYDVLSVHTGSELKGISYEAPFSFVEVEKGHQVVTANYVTDESGTGIVHTAPAYGEDDYKTIQEHNLSFVNVVNEKGQYTEAVPFLQGRFVKDCDVDIVRYLAEKGLLYSKEKYEHNYPHCWRCDTALLYYANDSWFIKTTVLQEQFIQNNEEVTWHPDHIKHGRFGNFLEQMVDWNISRKRYWGTPLNIWQCDSCDHEVAPKSIEELKQLSTDSLQEDVELHKPYVDHVHLACPSCSGTMTRTPEVIDVWFDSGAMPFAQYHYPFEKHDTFAQQFPADVVIEGIDQTRGWFYSLLAVSTLYTGKAPYKRVLSLGHVLDEHGQKMSKSKGNALDPVELINQYGADALRWALLVDSAPWNPKRFSERVVQEAKSKLVDTFMNVHSFYVLYAELDGFNPKTSYEVKRNKLDDWVLSRLHSVVKEVHEQLEAYNFTNATRKIAQFVEEVSNWYVRRSRERFWSQGMNEEKAAAYTTLYEVLTTVSKLLAPFTPFLAENVYTNLTGESVHLADYPTCNESCINQQLEEEMDAVLHVVELGRNIRNTTSLKVKQPLAKLSLLSNKEGLNWSAYVAIIQDELNVKHVDVLIDDGEIVSVKLKLNFKQAAATLGKHANTVNKWLQEHSNEDAKSFLERGYGEWNTESETVTIRMEDVLVEKGAKEGFASASNGDYTVTLDIVLTDELVQEGIAREFIRAVQEYRKQLNLPINMRVDIAIYANKDVQEVVTKYKGMLQENLLMRDLIMKEHVGEGKEINVGKYVTSIELISVS